ncbi:MAG: hypothetical protein IJ088_14005 [Clostridia bacterium]|nr:hypothetical protein [Clostridia bacterium]
MYENYIGRPLDDDIEYIIFDVVNRYHGEVTALDDRKIEIKMPSGMKMIGHKDFYISFIHGTPDFEFERILDVLTCR